MPIPHRITTESEKWNIDLPVFAIWIAFVALLVTAAATDVARYIIPNWVVLALTALFVPYVILTDISAAPFPALAVGSVVLVVCFVLFCIGAMGGGDAKLLAALGLWCGPPDIVPAIFVVALTGGCMALAVLVFLTIRNKAFMVKKGAEDDEDGENSLNCRSVRRPLPYGVAIAFGGVYLTVTRIGLL